MEGCVREMRDVVGKLGPGWELELFGSMATGFGTHESDIDATCFQAGAPEEEADTTGAAALLRERLVPLLQVSANFSITGQILSAKVPLLRLRYEDALDIDLSCRNMEALQNTRLLRAYAQFDQRVRDLGVLVKLWAKAAGVCGASGGHLSSYTFTLMAIYFMQVHLKLPCLPTSAFKDGREESEGLARLEAARAYWSCRLNLPELIYGFFWFYNFEFVWGSEVVCTRLGIRRYATDELFQSLRGRLISRFHVEDPYRLERNLHCVLGCAEEVQLRQALAEALHGLHVGKTPVGLWPESSAPPGDGPESPPGADEADALAVAGMAAVPALAPGAAPPSAGLEAEACPPDGALSEGSTASDAGAPEWRSPCGSFSSDDEKSRGRCQSSDDDEKVQRRRSGHEDGSPCTDVEATAQQEGQAQWPWWQHLQSANVVEAVRGSAPGPGAAYPPTETQRRTRYLTVQELEGRMGETQAGHMNLEKGGVAGLAGHTFNAKSKSTSAIAARVSKLCLEHVRYQ